MMHVSHILCLSVALISLWCSADAMRKQTYKVRGKLMCTSNPSHAANVKVKLIDEDSGPDPDDTMARGKTGRDGSFTLEGSERELTSIDPRLKIYHDCNDGVKPCQRKLTLRLPSKYINKKTFYDAGTINLETKFPGEERDCVH